ncbi:MAG TPA: DUF4910 domain-containing protein [Blastocatellia bacterium]|nr:DUF4910 domain-containing protein [Blastocatellia bacterium]
MKHRFRPCRAPVAPVSFAIAILVSAQVVSSAPLGASSLLSEREIHAIAGEVSGLMAKDTVIELSRDHRVQASSGYHKAAEYIAGKAKEYGLEQVQIEKFPADGKTAYYTLKSTPGWEAQMGQLQEVSPGNAKIADYAEMQVALADYAQSADVSAALLDVGEGDKPSDYEGRDVKDKIVLAGGPVATVHQLACDERGAAGIVSYQPNQVTGWSGDYADNVRWGHLSPYDANNKFAFMISLRQARTLRERLAGGQQIKLHATVKAEMTTADYEVVTGIIPGTDLPGEEIVFSCHLCHEKPGANDNASGAAAILEAARTLMTLIRRGEIQRPRRTIKFIWPPEINGTLAYFARHPDEVKHMRAAIHCDMVGGDYQITKSVLHVTHTPRSLPSYVNTVGDIFADYAIQGSLKAAMDGDLGAGLVSRNGSKDSLVADSTPYEMGSDHDVYEEGSFRVPVIYLRDWPDVFIHTNNDTPANIDPTKMKRSTFIAAACGYFLAAASRAQASNLADAVFAGEMARIPAEFARARSARNGPDGEQEARNIIAQSLDMSEQALSSVTALAPGDAGLESKVEGLVDQLSGTWLVLTGQLSQEHKGKRIYFVLTPPEQPAAKQKKGREKKGADDLGLAPDDTKIVPVRRVLGPMKVYYYDYLSDRVSPEDMAVVRRIEGMHGGDILLYEILNLVDGKRNIGEIRNYLAAEYEPIPIQYVSDYLKLLGKAGVVDLQQ